MPGGYLGWGSHSHEARGGLISWGLAGRFDLRDFPSLALLLHIVEIRCVACCLTRCSNGR